MPDFKRAFAPGGTFFFTVVTYARRPLFLSPMARQVLRTAIQQVLAVRSFQTVAVVLLPDHLHCLWTLPEDDADFSTRWRKIKETFTDGYLAEGGTEAPVTPGQARKGLRGVWQPRFWEHTIRDERDFRHHLDYIHFNPVKHGHVSCAHAWPWSTFAHCVEAGFYEPNWCCACNKRRYDPPDFTDIDSSAAE